MSDDLDILPEETRKKGGFGTSVVDGPGSACALGEANIALRTHRMAQQECRVSRRWRNRVGVVVRGVIFCAAALVTVPNAHASTRAAMYRLRTRAVFFIC